MLKTKPSLGIKTQPFWICLGLCCVSGFILGYIGVPLFYAGLTGVALAGLAIWGSK
jgi:hypothetical protein